MKQLPYSWSAKERASTTLTSNVREDPCPPSPDSTVLSEGCILWLHHQLAMVFEHITGRCFSIGKEESCAHPVT